MWIVPPIRGAIKVWTRRRFNHKLRPDPNGPHTMLCFGNPYNYGVGAPNHPVPALFVDCVANAGERWSRCLDTDAYYGHRR